MLSVLTTSIQVKKDNVLDLLKNKRFEIIRHDITFPLYLEIDQIYNLACPASPNHYQYDPVQTTKTNVHGAINILGLAKRVMQEFFKPLQVKFMEILYNILKKRSTGVMLIQ